MSGTFAEHGWGEVTIQTGCLYTDQTVDYRYAHSGVSQPMGVLKLQASRSNSLYGASSTVQTASFQALIIIKT